MTREEYARSLLALGVKPGNKGVIQNADGTTTLVYAVAGCQHDVYLAPDTDMTDDQRRAQYEAVARQIEAMRTPGR